MKLYCKEVNSEVKKLTIEEFVAFVKAKEAELVNEKINSYLVVDDSGNTHELKDVLGSPEAADRRGRSSPEVVDFNDKVKEQDSCKSLSNKTTHKLSSTSIFSLQMSKSANKISNPFRKLSSFKI